MSDPAPCEGAASDAARAPQAGTILIEFARVADAGVSISRMRLPASCTLGEAIAAGVGAGVLPPDILDACVPAIYGRAREPGHPVREGDRIELTGPLKVDPKLARQRRAQTRRDAQEKDKWRGPR